MDTEDRVAFRIRLEMAKHAQSLTAPAAARYHDYKRSNSERAAWPVTMCEEKDWRRSGLEAYRAHTVLS